MQASKVSMNSEAIDSTLLKPEGIPIAIPNSFSLGVIFECAQTAYASASAAPESCRAVLAVYGIAWAKFTVFMSRAFGCVGCMRFV